jgi:hypothetical protein
MCNHIESTTLHGPPRAAARMGSCPTPSASSGRAIHAVFRSWLAVPGVVFTCVVGPLVLVARRQFGDVVQSQACHPRTQVGSEAFRC